MTQNADGHGETRRVRAHQLAAAAPAAADLLSFYAALTAWQQSLTATTHETGGATLDAALDRVAVAAAIPRLIDWLPEHAPSALAAVAGSLARTPATVWLQRLDAFIARGDDDGDADPHVAFVIEAAVQPFAELAASRASVTASDLPAVTNRCRFCGRRPALASLRDAGHGTKRGLICGVCASEWRAPRIGCVSCGESDFANLPVFSAEGLHTVRIEACETCRLYLKAIDFTRDGHAEPAVDDIATVSLDLWAREQGYRRLRPHLLGV